MRSKYYADETYFGLFKIKIVDIFRFWTAPLRNFNARGEGNPMEIGRGRQ